MGRRDLKSGQQTAQAILEAEGVRLSISWGEPNAGVSLTTCDHCMRRSKVRLIVMAVPKLYCALQGVKWRTTDQKACCCKTADP